MVYIFTLDSHDCYGPFQYPELAHEWAWLEKFGAYQVLPEPPPGTTVVHHPADVFLSGREV